MSKGVETWVSYGYFVSLKSAAQELGNRLIRRSDAESITELVQVAEDVQKALTIALTPLLDRVENVVVFDGEKEDTGREAA